MRHSIPHHSKQEPTNTNPFPNVPHIPSLPRKCHPRQATNPATSASYAALKTEQHLHSHQHPSTIEHQRNSPSNTHPNSHYSSENYSTSGSAIIPGTPELAHKSIGTEAYVIQQGIMDNIYSYSHRGLRSLDLAEAINEVLDHHLLSTLPSSAAALSTMT